MLFGLGAVLLVAAGLFQGLAGGITLALGCYVLLFPSRRGIPVLVYHSVNPDSAWMGAPDLVVSVKLFARQMAWLSACGYKSLWMDDLLAAKKRGQAGRLVGIHFDDGYLDAMTSAEPVLRRYGLKGTVFVSPALLRDAPEHETLPSRRDLDGRFFLAAGELEQLSSGRTMEVQAHGWSHRALDALPPEELRAELADARSWLSALLRCAVRHVCFPRDARNEAVVKAALSAGYIGYTGGKGRNVPAEPAGEVSRIYVTESGRACLDLLLFKADVLLFRGIYILWPFRAVLKRLVRRSWRLAERERVTP